MRTAWITLLLALGIVVLLVAPGCVFSRFGESVSDGTNVTTTRYTACSSAWPMGKLESGNHNFGYKWGNSKVPNEITVGQTAQGLDNTAQAQFMSALIQAAAQVATSGVLTPQPAAAAPGAAKPTAQPTLADLLTAIQSLRPK